MRALALGTLVLAATASAQGGDGGKFVREGVEKYIDLGDFEKAAGFLGGSSQFRLLAASLDQSCLLLRRAADDAFWIGHGDDDSKALVKKLGELVDACTEKEPEHATALRAKGELEILRARFERSREGGQRAEAAKSFQAAADFHDRAHDAEASEGQSLARAVCALIEKAWAAPAGRPELLAAADARAKRLEADHGSSPQATWARAAVNLERAKDLAATAKTPAEWAEVKALLEPSLPRLAALAEPVDADKEFGAKHQEIVEFALANPKAGLDAKFLGREFRVGPIRAEAPVSRLFRPKPLGGGQHNFRFYQWTPEGHLRRSVLFGHYLWSTEYTDGPKGIAGDNAKGLCTGDLDEASAIVEKSKRTKPVTKGRINKHIPVGYVFEVAGKDALGEPCAVRGFYFKSEQKPITPFVWIEDYGETGQGDFAGAFLVDSIRE